MDIIDICDKIRQLEEYIDLAKQELDAKALDWNISGDDMITIINQFPF